MVGLTAIGVPSYDRHNAHRGSGTSFSFPHSCSHAEVLWRFFRKWGGFCTMSGSTQQRQRPERNTLGAGRWSGTRWVGLRVLRGKLSVLANRDFSVAVWRGLLWPVSLRRIAATFNGTRKLGTNRNGYVNKHSLYIMTLLVMTCHSIFSKLS